MPRTVRKDANLKAGRPEKPEHLSPAASVAWDRLIRQLEQSQIELSPGHSRMLMLAATIEADLQSAWAAVQEHGEYVVNKKTGALQAHPASKRLDALRRDYVKILTVLGTRAVPAPPPDETPSLEDVLNGTADAE